MYRHAIITHMSYINKERIAFHVSFQDSSIVKEIHKKLREKFQDLRFGFHVIQTQSDSIESIAKRDSYFEGIKYYTDYDQFIAAVELDIKMKSTDAVKVVLSRNTFSPLYMQNVVFSCYTHYLKEYKTDLFKDKFEAWKDGPVIPSLYQSLKSYKNKSIDKLDDYEKKVLHARFLQIPNGREIKKLINQVADENSTRTDNAIYQEAHAQDAPWTLTYYNPDKGRSHEISKDDIKDYAQRI